MTLSVNDRARAIATFRFVEVRLMEIAAAWTPSTPEMEVKVMLGRHIWEFAQHADALGKRTFELRRPEQWSLAPADAYGQLLEDVARIDDTPGRLAHLYDGIVPGLERRYRAYLSDTDSLLDGPSVVVIERILPDLARQRVDADRVRLELGLPAAVAGRADDCRRRDEAIRALVAPGEIPA
jgi:hypothetical protein